ncbi:unnamed protein product [Mytilus coruscus]|uniref:Endonuclease/exonuclease/phosphatase domain-containing protein n=1 Tax=Mytilus coruscus TaxID=42192 RepID=A0A6J8C390_MYTCO|nr:unnamed protein product [Mytilus coruscus]
MPRANKRGAAESSGPARRSSRTPAKAEPEPVKKAKGASASSDASPAKVTRKASPSPAPTCRGRSAKAAQKGQGDESTQKGRVTRAVVKDKEEETVTSRGRSSTRKTDKPKEDPPARSGRGKSTGTPSKTAKATPKKNETPKGGRGKSARGRGKKEEPAEEEADDDEEEEAEEEEEPPKKTTPKGRAKAPAKSPAKAKTPSPAKKSPKTTPKPAASRSRSRGGKKEEVPSPQVVLEKMDTSDVMESKDSEETATEKTQEVEVKSPRGRRAKTLEKPSPSPSSRPSRSRRSGQKEEENSEETADKAEEEQESSKDTEEPQADEKVDQETEKSEEKMEEEVKETSEKSEEQMEEEVKETSEKSEEQMEEKDVKAIETTEPLEDSAEDLQKETQPVEIEVEQEKSPEEPPTEQVTDEPLAAKESQEEEKAEEPQPEQPVQVVTEQKKEVPTINIEAASDAVDISDEETASSLVAEPALSEAVQISDDSQSVPEEAVVVPDEEPVQSEPIAVDETPVPAQNSVNNEPEVMEVESNQSGEPVCTDGDLNGQPESRKRKISDVEETEKENVEAKRACVTEEQVVQENGETSQPSEKENSAKVTQYMDDVTTRSTEDDYVMVNKADVPDSNSKEVLDSLPQQSSDSVQSKIDSIGKLGPLFNRKFIQNPSFKAESSDSSKQFTVVSYNILAQCHLERNDYSFTPSEFLSLEKRHQKMMSEFQYLDADVVCLQEVEPKYFEQLLQPAMLSLGYSGIMKKRTQEYFDEGKMEVPDIQHFGKNKYTSLATLANKEVEDASLDTGVKAAVQKYLEKPDVISCAIKALLNLAESDSNPHILCGDFNSEATSPGYQLVLEGFLSDDMIDQLQSIENVDMPDGTKKALFNQLYRAFQHPSSNIKSSYLSTQGTEPTVTSYNRVMRAAVDYIFYSASSLDNIMSPSNLHCHSNKSLGIHQTPAIVDIKVVHKHLVILKIQ